MNRGLDLYIGYIWDSIHYSTSATYPVYNPEGRKRRRSLGNVSVACVIVWLCFLIVSFSGCCLIVGSLWNASVCLLSVCVGCLGDRAYCFLLVLPHLLLILPLLHNTIYCYIEPALAPNVKEMQQNAIRLRHPGRRLANQTNNGWDDMFYK